MLQLPKKVEIIEVGPRDGLQNEKSFVPTEVKKEFIHSLKGAGIKEMELTSFVSPKWVPQMGDAAEIVADCLDSDTRNIVLAPNKKGIERVYMTGCKAVAVFVGVSNTFNQKNINKTTAESLAEVLPLIAELKSKDYFVRACISTAFYCPYEGKVDEDEVLALCGEFVDAGVDELSVADTIGMAAPHESYSLFSKLKDAYPDVMLTAHFHDTRKLALSNILASLQAGVTRFDTSAGGLGGCPFAPGAAGNAATEDVVYMLHRMGIDTGVNLDMMLKAIEVVKPHLSRQIESTYFKLNSVTV
ncbi:MULTISPECIES: hydroxymethylglutaryl-CoA lyase [unclassified Bacillus (in: firmicutes)]|uniref:hydroxymethylglutaryl-CoA lyase n=1 Tax=unclassified Bacillus (in: firmicutes) TaxID=185979 RepID=UPI001BE4E282|nr:MULTISPECIES: hydroxymethylglutaryl-CoA lyase [unclassified Bacillus (in: firmicutes)]MBT2638788.1 hydroxymethylglutaryl-CoA lyase [Bacillus sp. ISL-39]MBT2660931.1 hydroxymethylglutaryl-CoA lyase [Bacillus sp. ISL-45]